MVQTKHGARIKVVFEGKVIGALQQVSGQEDHGQQAIYQISELTPMEIVSLRFSGTFNYSKVVIAKQRIKDLQHAERENKTVQQITREILTREGFTIVLEDKFDNTVIQSISGCKLGSLSFTVSEGTLMSQNGSGQFGVPMITP